MQDDLAESPHQAGTNSRTRSEDLLKRGWEMELLVSGLLVFALYQAPVALRTYWAYFIVRGNAEILNRSNLMHASFAILATLLIGLSLHFVLRILWVGLIGFIIGFPREPEYGQFSTVFQRFLSKPQNDVHQFAARVDRVASSIFGIVFYVVMMNIGIYLVFSNLFGYLLPRAGLWDENLNWIIVCIAVVYLFDFISFGTLKKIKNNIFSKIYFLFYKLVGILFLAYLARPFYHRVASHSKKAYVLILCTILLIASTIAGYQMSPQMYWDKKWLPREINILPNENEFADYNRFSSQKKFISDYFYQDKRLLIPDPNPYNLVLPYIQSDIFTNELRTIRLSIPIYSVWVFRQLTTHSCPNQKPFFDLGVQWQHLFDLNTDRYTDTSTYAQAQDVDRAISCLASLFEVSIDDSVTTTTWKMGQANLHFATRPSLSTYLPIDSLLKGSHYLRIRLKMNTISTTVTSDTTAKDYTSTISSFVESYDYHIPFYVE